jgi:hypothetical protein
MPRALTRDAIAAFDWRARAFCLRRLANSLGQEDKQDELLRMASQWEWMAERLERRLPAPYRTIIRRPNGR